VEEDMMEVLEMSMNRVPVLQENGIQTFFNGPESYSHDGRFNLGESPNLKGYFLLAGVNSTAIQSGSGAEKALADWIMTGHPPMDSAEMDSARIEDWQARDIYWQEHCPQTIVLTYAMQWPRRQREKARNLRRTQRSLNKLGLISPASAESLKAFMVKTLLLNEKLMAMGYFYVQ
jgi:hypothetical protein